MPDADTQNPAATAVADPPAASSPGSTAVADRPQVGSASSFDAIFAQALAGIPADDPSDVPALNGDAPPAETPPAATQDARSTPDAGVKAADAEPSAGEPDEAPPEAGKPLSRRQQIAADKDAEIARLTALVAERDPETLKSSLRDQVRAEIEAEQARTATAGADEEFLGNQERFDRLKAQPYLTLSYEDQQWLDEKEDRRLQYAPVDRHIRSIYEQRLAQARAADEQSVAALRNDVMATVGGQISELASLPGVDSSDWKTPGRTFRDYGQALYEGGRATGAAEKEAELMPRVEKAEAEAARSVKEIEDARLQLRGATPAPVPAGRSGSGTPNRPQADPDGSWESNLGAAFGWSTTTH